MFSKKFRLVVFVLELLVVAQNLFGPDHSLWVLALFAFMAGGDFIELLAPPRKSKLSDDDFATELDKYTTECKDFNLSVHTPLTQKQVSEIRLAYHAGLCFERNRK